MRRLRHLTDFHRTSSTNRALGYLMAFNAGAINAGGFTVLELYTSHMTGFMSMLADHLVLGNTALVLAALSVLNLADGFTMPRYSAEWDAAVQQIEAALTESRSAVTSADPWDSTVAYAFGDPVHCGLLYGVPDGMGIQFDEAAYLTDPAHEIHSRYVLTAADTPTAARLQADGWTVLYESDRGVLYEHGTM